MPTVSLPHLTVYFESHGEGSPVILLNGLGLDVAAWGPQIQALSRAHRVIAFDARGVGRTSAPPPPYSVTDMASDALSLLDALEIERAHFLGLSMGGLVAQRFAIAHPSRVRSIVLAATAARLPPRARHVIDLWGRMASTETAPEVLLREQLAWAFSDAFFADERLATQVIGSLLEYPFPPSPQGIAGQAAACVGHDTRDELSRVRAPALVLSGRDDRLLPVSASQELAAGIPGAQLSILDGAGHAFCTECAERFNAQILELLAKVEQSHA